MDFLNIEEKKINQTELHHCEKKQLRRSSRTYGALHNALSLFGPCSISTNSWNGLAMHGMNSVIQIVTVTYSISRQKQTWQRIIAKPLSAMYLQNPQHLELGYETSIKNKRKIEWARPEKRRRTGQHIVFKSPFPWVIPLKLSSGPIIAWSGKTSSLIRRWWGVLTESGQRWRRVCV